MGRRDRSGLYVAGGQRSSRDIHNAGRDYWNVRMSEQPRLRPWAKAMAGVGMMICIAAFGLFGFALFTVPDDPRQGPPPLVPVAAGVFFAGFVVAGIAAAFGQDDE